MYGMWHGYTKGKWGGSMNGSIAKALRKMAYNEWVMQPEEYRKVLTVRMFYKRIKAEYKKERKNGA